MAPPVTVTIASARIACCKHSSAGTPHALLDALFQFFPDLCAIGDLIPYGEQVGKCRRHGVVMGEIKNIVRIVGIQAAQRDINGVTAVCWRRGVGFDVTPELLLKFDELYLVSSGKCRVF